MEVFNATQDLTPNPNLSNGLFSRFKDYFRNINKKQWIGFLSVGVVVLGIFITTGLTQNVQKFFSKAFISPGSYGYGDFGTGQYIGVLAAASPSPSSTTQPSASPNTTYGWDYNLTKQCIRSVRGPNTANYYQDITGCAQPLAKWWTIAVQAESAANQSCLGPNSQSLPINNQDLSINWLPHTDELGRSNKTVHLKIDNLNHPHLCGSGNFTWLALQDNISNGGGPIPRPDQAKTSMKISFSDNRINGEDRIIVGYQGFWMMNSTPKAITIEVSFVSPGWGAPEDPAHNIIKKTINNGNYEISMDGNNMIGKFGIQANPRNGDTTVNINWYEIVQYLIANQIIPNVDGGVWTNSNSSGAIAFVAIEAENKAATQSILSEIWITNFRIEAVEQDSSLRGDVNGDGVVNLADFNIFARDYRDKNLRSDFNNNGRVDLADLNLLIRNFR